MEEDKQLDQPVAIGAATIRLVDTNNREEESPQHQHRDQDQQRPADRSSTHLPELVLGPVFQEKVFERHLSIICLDEYDSGEETPTSIEVSYIQRRTNLYCLTIVETSIYN